MFSCDKCESAMIEDFSLTSAYFDDRVETIIDEDGNIIYEHLPQKLYFICGKCGYSKPISIEDIIKELQKRSLNALLYSRLNFVYRNVPKDNIDEANGVSYCGICQGVVDGSGTCYNDVINKCVLRNKILKD